MLETFRTLIHDGALKLAGDPDVAEEALDLRLAATTGGAPAPAGAPAPPRGTATDLTCASCHDAAVPVAGWWCFECHAAFARSAEGAQSSAA